MKGKCFYKQVSLFLLFMGLVSCTGMDETYKEFLSSTKTYVGKIRNAVTYPGKNRILLTWSPITDPRVVSMEVSWENGGKTLVKEILSEKDTSLVIGPLEEGSYSFNIRTLDKYGHVSLAESVSGEVYGNFYSQMLSNRLIESMDLDEGKLTILFNEHISETFVGQSIYYYSSIEQDTVEVQIERETTQVILPGYESEYFKVVSYYNPNPFEFDIFASPDLIEYTPSVPLQIYPMNDLDNVSCCPKLEWRPILGDKTVENYRIMLSENGQDWVSFTPDNISFFRPRTALTPNTRYYWKVLRGDLESDIRMFTTGNKDMYGDGEVLTLTTSSHSSRTSNFVFIGEGFLQDDYKVNGVFDKLVQDAYETLFKVDPYKTYKEYFNVYQINLYSNARGITKDNSFLGVTYDQSLNELSCDKEKVNSYLKKIEGWIDDDINNTNVIIIVNENLDAENTCYYSGGETISLCPTYSNPDDLLFGDFRYSVLRQAGGFGYGLLGYEGIDSQDAISEDKINELKNLWKDNRALNLALFPEDGSAPEESVFWKDIIGVDGYEKAQKVYEGGFGFRKGVLRSEQSSALDESRLPYFNVASRMAIVQRIMRVAGEEFTMEKFLEKDYPGLAQGI